MALPKTFRSVNQISGVSEGSTQTFQVDWDTTQELVDAIHDRITEKETPAAEIVAACTAARANLPPHS